jgi:hypothetical protein
LSQCAKTVDFRKEQHIFYDTLLPINRIRLTTRLQARYSRFEA